METKTEGYVCPYCRRSHSHSWSDVKEEEELLKSDCIGRELNRTYWLETKMKFNVRMCGKCAKNLKIRLNILIGLLWIMTGFGVLSILGLVIDWILNNIFQSEIATNISAYLFLCALIVAVLAGVFWVLWQLFGPSRPHVTYKRAKKCNAIEGPQW